VKNGLHGHVSTANSVSRVDSIYTVVRQLQPICNRNRKGDSVEFEPEGLVFPSLSWSKDRGMIPYQIPGMRRYRTFRMYSS